MKPLKVHFSKDRHINPFGHQGHGTGRYAGRERQANQGSEKGDFQNLISQADADLKIIAKNLRDL
jgi:hypothetical protein